jgi:predicted phage terminase large subunit-like protein
MSDLAPGLSTAALEEHLSKLERVRFIHRARTDFLEFCKIMMPDPDDPENVFKTSFEVAPHHEKLARDLERAERGEILRLIVAMPPRHGKTHMMKCFEMWCVGRDPSKQVAFGTYNDDYASDVGKDVKDALLLQRYRDVFPALELRDGAQSSIQVKFTRGGAIRFVGRGTALTGRGFHLGIVDDPLKDAEEAASVTIREKMWQWFLKVFFTRRMSAGTVIIIVMTRWHEDDLVGRLIDPNNPAYDAEIARQWTVLSLPAEAELNDPLGRKPGEALWPSRFGLKFLQEYKRMDAIGYAALYQQRPSPEEGAYFKADEFVTYLMHERPKLEDLRIYAASDHATGKDKKKHDASVFLIVGVCKNNLIWLLDCFWDRVPPEQAVEQMLDMMLRWRPIMWWAEKGHITDSIGPFLYDRARQRQINVILEPVVPVMNKEQRAQSAKGAMGMKRVMFPKSAGWYSRARHELLQFPNGANDDFVDTLSLVGLKLMQVIGAVERRQDPKVIPGSFGWFKRESKRMERELKQLAEGAW